MYPSVLECLNHDIMFFVYKLCVNIPKLSDSAMSLRVMWLWL